MNDKRAAGRPRTRPPVQRLTVEIDRELFNQMDALALVDRLTYRKIIEESLQLWLASLGRDYQENQA